MSEPAIDHRRATAERNAIAILDAAERLLAEREPLSMVAIAAEAGVSRPTLYAHFKTINDVVEAAAERAVEASVAAIESAEPGEGPADEALERMIAASWGRLAHFDALARGAAEYLSPRIMHRTHGPVMSHMQALVERGRGDGAFRTDLPADWLVTAVYALIHAADDHARTNGLRRDAALEMLVITVRDLFEPR
jgi:TetR/AcrR family transcriptional repressor of mexCD-oprJ operon